MTAQRARELFTYDEDTGKLYWENPTANNVKKGDEAGTSDRFYRNVKADGKRYKAHPDFGFTARHGQEK